jgi:DNA-binding XRE family transcriptional regulator
MPFKSPFLVKCATPDMAQIIAKAGELRPTWLFDVRTVLGVSQAEMAELIGASRRNYQRWETNPAGMSIEAYRRAQALLEVANRDSRGKLRIA